MPNVLWLTGLPCSGKTTLAGVFVKSHPNYISLDGDNIRRLISADLDFSMKCREENVRRVASIAKLLLNQNTPSIVSILSPLEAHRSMARDIIGNNLKIIYLNAPLNVCEKRDIKGMYKKARNGTIKNFTGIDSLYESPLSPDLVLDTSNESINACLLKINSLVP